MKIYTVLLNVNLLSIKSQQNATVVVVKIFTVVPFSLATLPQYSWYHSQ